MRLTQDELLILLIEECGEVIQAATKCLRFGFDVDHGTGYGNNKVALSKECGDLLAVVDALPLDQIASVEAQRSKLKRAEKAKGDFGRAALSKPAPVAANASAEARLREALRDLVALVSTDSRYDDSESLRSARNILFAENKAAMLALSAHPHASDCDKQGER